MKQRTRRFALRAIHLVSALPSGLTPNVVGRQLLRSGCSVGANYRAACRARSKRDFISKLAIVEEELDESLYWMELLRDTEIVSREELQPVMAEATELLSIIVASVRTAKRRS
jgi:four helix bundle protein